MLASSLAQASTALSPLVGSASGYALTFDGRGTDIATAQLPAELFHGASGLTVSFWCRTIGLIGAPYRVFPFSMTTSTESNFFQPFQWMNAGRDLLQMVFAGSNQVMGNPQLHFDAFREWKHVSVAWDPRGVLRTFLDGEFFVNATGIQPWYNISNVPASGVFLGVGVYAVDPTTHNPAESLRGSIDQLQLWTRALDAEQIRADYRSLGSSAILPEPIFRYTFDEGTGDTAASTGATAAPPLQLGRNPDGGSFFNTNIGTTTHRYTTPAWAASDLPLNDSTVGGAPIVRTYLPGRDANVSLVLAARDLAITSLPAHGQLLVGGEVLSAGAVVKSDAVITFRSNPNASAARRTSFNFMPISGRSAGNGIVHLIAEAPPQIVLFSPPCRWPRGILQCDEAQLVTSVREDNPTVIMLIGRSPHGAPNLSAVVTRAPRTGGHLYQMCKCCDAVSGRGALIRDGDTVLDLSAAVVFVPAAHSSGSAVSNFSFRVLDASGTSSNAATMIIDVVSVEDAPVLAPMATNTTHPITAVRLPLQAYDADGDPVTLVLEQPPAHGRVVVPGPGPGLGIALSTFRGGGVPLNQILRQHAVDLVGSSSHWPSSSTGGWHPLQVLGAQGAIVPISAPLLATSACCTQITGRTDAWCRHFRSQMPLSTGTVRSHGARGFGLAIALENVFPAEMRPT